MAVTHTEVYRPFAGELRARRLPWWPIASAGIRIAWKKKLPILLLYIPVGIATIVSCFTVYGAFLLGGSDEPLSPQEMIVAAMASQLLEVRGIISQFNGTVGAFSMLAMAWFGAGLICEDRRVNAHLLYFARPIRRLDYVLGKLAAIGFWGLCTSFLSGIIICIVAIFTSPDWIFLTEQYGTIFLTIGYSLTWIVAFSSMTLAISSLLPRKTFALVGIIASFSLSTIVAQALVEILDQPVFGVLSPVIAFDEFRVWIFSPSGKRDAFSEVWPFAAAVIGYSIASWSLIAWRVRRLEVVA